MRIEWVGPLLAAGFLLSGCASVTRGWNEQIQFDSEPPGAVVRTEIVSPCGGPCTASGGNERDPNPVRDAGAWVPDKGPSCVTPCMAQVRRADVLLATFTKDGYAPETIKMQTRVAGAGAAGFVGNVVLGGVLGAGIDAASGATLEHCPNPVIAHLRPIGVSAAPGRGPRQVAQPAPPPARAASDPNIACGLTPAPVAPPAEYR